MCEGSEWFLWRGLHGHFIVAAISCVSTGSEIHRELARLQHEVAALRADNEQRQAELTQAYGIVQCEQLKTEELKQCLLDIHQQLREKDEEIQANQERMSRVKAHLEVIAEGLDGNNSMSRKMLLNLTAQFF